MSAAQASHTKIIIGGIAGNVMEWYDFAVYGYFAPIIGKLFYPSEDPVASLVAAYGAFAAGFLMRPIGGLVFGYIGDKIGRKSALTLSVLMMAIPTFLVGVLPTALQIGVTASIMMVLLRMAQGLSVGGEYTTSIVFLVEHAHPKKRGFMGSWSVFGAVTGILLGSAVSALLNTMLTQEAIHQWGWRIPFLVGIAVGVVGLLIRKHIPEAAREPETEQRKASPIVEAFRNERPAMFKVMGFNVVNAVGFYMIFVYVATYLVDIVKVPSSEALDINTLSMIALLLVIPLAGILSDRIGRKPVLIASCIGIILFGYPLFLLMHHPNFAWILTGQFGFALLIGSFMGVGPVTMVEALPCHVRCSALSVGYNICLAVFGGTTPMVAAYVINKSHDDLSIAYYLIAAALISLVVLVKLRESPSVALA